MADTITHPIFSLQDTTTTLTPLELLLSRQNSSVTPLESLKKSITETTLPSLYSKSSTLLLKRHSSLDFDDLLVKKVKTQSTNYSDCGSRQQSFISQEKIESDDKDDDNSSIFEENFSIEGLTIVDPSSKGLFYIPPLEEMKLELPQLSRGVSQPTIPMLVESNISDSRTLLQQSLETLKSQFIFSQLKDLLLQNLFPTQQRVQAQQPVRIPPFIGATNSKVDSETMIPPFKELNRLPKKVEEELAVTYGAVEFPFLSFSTEFENAHNTRSHFAEMENSLPLIQMNMNLPVQEEKQKKQKKTNVIFKIQKTNKVQESVMERKKMLTTKENKEIKVQKTEKKIFQESKKVFPIVKKPSPNKSKDIPVPAFINLAQKTAKNSSVKADNNKDKMEIEEEKEVPKRKRSYSFLRFGKRRGEERKKNRWQVSQDEKLGDLLLASIQNLSNNHCMMFEGVKKKGVQIPLGDEHQVDMKSSLVDCKRENPREPRLKWDPSVHKEADMQRYFKDASAIVDSEVNQEILIGYLLKNLNDITKARKHIKANKGKIAQELALKTLE